MEAKYYINVHPDKVECTLCPHRCKISDKQYGLCRVRNNENGKLIAKTFGCVSAIHSDPIEKKPLYHFYPGSSILSVGSFGCNLACDFCQNCSISQIDPGAVNNGKYFSPETLAKLAKETEGNLGMAYTYNEPTVWFEYMLNIALELRNRHLKNIVVTNGFIELPPLLELLPVIDAFNVDLKGFSSTFYETYTRSKLAPVLQTLETIYKEGKHLEITHLVIPGLNDSTDDFERMTDWIAHSLGPEVPLHISRYYPNYQRTTPPTSMHALIDLYHRASDKLHYVFLGNTLLEDYERTYCPGCKKVLIDRRGYNVKLSGISVDSHCIHCNAFLPVQK